MKLIKLWWHCLVGTIKLGDHRMVRLQRWYVLPEVTKGSGKKNFKILDEVYCSCGYMKNEELILNTKISDKVEW
jgi:hypothetical protein